MIILLFNEIQFLLILTGLNYLFGNVSSKFI